jgi:hypothetical protein
MHATDGTRGTATRHAIVYRDPILQSAIATGGLAVALGAFLFYRRATGSLDAPLPFLQLLATAAVLLVWAVVFRRLLSLDGRTTPALGVPLVAIALFALACSYPGRRVFDWAVWLLAIAAVLLFERAAKSMESWRRRAADSRNSPDAQQVGRDAEIMQQLTRYRTASGQDVVRGTLAAQFVTGERTTTLYVAFCPPFERLPRVDAEVLEDSSAAVKLAQVLHNGIQLEVRLAKAAPERRMVSVEFFAAEPTEIT